MRRSLPLAALVLGLAACAGTPPDGGSNPIVSNVAVTAPVVAPAPVPLGSPALGDITTLVASIPADAAFAMQLANASSPPDNYGRVCYQAVSIWAQGVSLTLSALPTALPKPHLITSFELLRQGIKLANGGVPEPIVIGCAPLAQDSATDVLTILSKILTAAQLQALQAAAGVPIGL